MREKTVTVPNLGGNACKLGFSSSCELAGLAFTSSSSSVNKLGWFASSITDTVIVVRNLEIFVIRNSLQAPCNGCDIGKRSLVVDAILPCAITEDEKSLLHSLRSRHWTDLASKLGPDVEVLKLGA